MRQSRQLTTRDIDSRPYSEQFGRSPRGLGNWTFALSRSSDEAAAAEPVTLHYRHRTYGSARGAALVYAWEHGYDRIAVVPTSPRDPDPGPRGPLPLVTVVVTATGDVAAHRSTDGARLAATREALPSPVAEEVIDQADGTSVRLISVPLQS